MELTEEERKKWDVDPDEWPHTPPFHVFAALYDEDHNLWWRAGSGHGMNAYDAARAKLDEVAELADRWDLPLPTVTHIDRVTVVRALREVLGEEGVSQP